MSLEDHTRPNDRMFKKELDSKENTFIQLRRLAGELSSSDSAWITPQISGLSTRWEKLRGLSRNRDDKLARSKARAQDFADQYNDNVKWLNEAEQRVDAIALLLESENTPSLMEKARFYTFLFHIFICFFRGF